MTQRGGVDGQLGMEEVGGSTAFTPDLRTQGAALPGSGYDLAVALGPLSWGSQGGDF